MRPCLVPALLSCCSWSPYSSLRQHVIDRGLGLLQHLHCTCLPTPKVKTPRQPKQFSSPAHPAIAQRLLSRPGALNPWSGAGAYMQLQCRLVFWSWCGAWACPPKTAFSYYELWGLISMGRKIGITARVQGQGHRSGGVRGSAFVSQFPINCSPPSPSHLVDQPPAATLLLVPPCSSVVASRPVATASSRRRRGCLIVSMQFVNVNVPSPRRPLSVLHAGFFALGRTRDGSKSQRGPGPPCPGIRIRIRFPISC